MGGGGLFREWDYHTFALISERGGAAYVLDLDSALPWPTPGTQWVANALRFHGERCFRVVKSSEYLEHAHLAGPQINFMEEFVAMDATKYGRVSDEAAFANALLANNF